MQDGNRSQSIGRRISSIAASPVCLPSSECLRYARWFVYWKNPCRFRCLPAWDILRWWWHTNATYAPLRAVFLLPAIHLSSGNKPDKVRARYIRNDEYCPSNYRKPLLDRWYGRTSQEISASSPCGSVILPHCYCKPRQSVSLSQNRHASLFPSWSAYPCPSPESSARRLRTHAPWKRALR